MARFVVSFSLILLLCFFPLAFVQAQSTVNNATQTGFPTLGTFSGSNFDQVSYQNGNLHISIPIQNIPQRNGKTYSYSFVYNLPSWTETGTFNPNHPSYSWVVSPTNGIPWLNWALASNVSGWTVQYQNGNVQCATSSYGVIENVSITDPEGTIHPVLIQLTNATNPPPPTCALNIPEGLTTDGSGILVTNTPAWSGGIPSFTATLKDGTKVELYSSTPSWEDNNGNEMSATADMLNRDPLIVYNAPNTNYTTPLGNTATGPAYTTWTFTDSNGTSQSYTLNYEGIDVLTSFKPIPGGTVTQWGGVMVVPSSLTLPSSGGVYTFGWKNSDSGELASVGLPTGGSINYTYQVGPPTVTQTFNLVNCAAGTGSCTEVELVREQVASRTVTDNSGTHTWNYSWSGGTQGGGTVTDPLGNQEVHTYAFISYGPTCAAGGCSSTSYETEVQYENPSGTVLRTVAKTYVADAVGGGAGSSFAGNVRLTSETTTLNDVTPNLVKQVNYTYEVISSNYLAPGTSYNTTWMNPTSISESDWGSGSPGSILRYTTYTYLHDPSSGGNYAQYLSRNIADKVLVKSIYDSTSLTCQGLSQACATTTNEYDNYTRSGQTMQASNAVQHDSANYSTAFVYRGNLTAVSHWLNTTGSNLTSTNQYDDSGNLLSTIDPLGNTTTMSYADSWANTACEPSGQGKAYVTSITNALTQSTNNTFNSCTGLRASTTDFNSQITSYSYDFADRKTQTSFPDGGQVGTTYNDAPPISATTTTKITTTLNEVSTTVKDYLGRVSQTQLTSDPQGTDYTVTTYDALGRTSTTSNPYRTTSDTTYGITTDQYDALSRVTTVIPPDGTATSDNVSTAYDIYLGIPAGNPTTFRDCTIVTDEAGKARESCSDGLGRLTQVFEDPYGLNYETDYSYDALGDLLSVTQKGGSTSSANWRTRTFTYDSLSRLLCAANPEIQAVTCPTTAAGTFPSFGATLYTYDSDGNVLTKTAPSPNQLSTGTKTVTITYKYDALNRLTSKKYNDTDTANPATASVLYGYDGVALTGCITTPQGDTDSYPIGRRTAMCDGSGATSYTHDKMGRILQERRTIGGVVGKYETDAYNLDGSPISITTIGYGVAYTYNGARRPITAESSNSPVNYFVTGATYAPPGGLAGFTNGSSISGAITYNSRLQPMQMYFTNGTISTRTLNQLNQTTCPTTTATIMNQSYNFGVGTNDNGNVLSIANCVNTNRTENFTYDSLNRITSGYSSGSQWGETFTIDAWGNLYSRNGVAGKTNYEPLTTTAGTNNQLAGFSYDPAGNMTANGSATYVYDAENRLIATAGYSYIYDGDGERVEKCTEGSTAGTCASGANGTLYWRGMGSDTLAETSLAGSVLNNYVYFDGQRVARVDSTGAVHYYFSDHLGTHAVVENAAGTACEQDIDYYPYGGEQNDYCGTPVVQNYKFNGKERDVESGLDNFGARYNTSNLGRFMTPDWAAKPVSVPYASFGNPQSLNLYAYTENNPSTLGDPDGHCDTCMIARTNGYGEGLTLSPAAFYSEQTSTNPLDAMLAAIAQAEQAQADANRKAAQASAPAQNQANGAGQAHGAGQQGDVATANHYLSRSKEMRLVQKAFKSGHYHLEIIHDGNDRYDPATRTVYWDPHSALQTTEGGHQTPALGLGHEMAHATGNRHDTAVLSNTPDAHYDTMEERRVILNYENPAARELGESTRSNHGGVPYNVDCPTCQ